LQYLHLLDVEEKEKLERKAERKRKIKKSREAADAALEQARAKRQQA
jgi:hypothetical protein